MPYVLINNELKGRYEIPSHLRLFEAIVFLTHSRPLAITNQFVRLQVIAHMALAGIVAIFRLEQLIATTPPADCDGDKSVPDLERNNRIY